MVTKRIIPCLDVDNGRVVKGINFVNLRDAGDPIILGKWYSDQGADELVFLDITASSDRRSISIDFVTKTANQLRIPFTVGGGIRNTDTIRQVLLAGADKVSLNTAAVTTPQLISDGAGIFGSQCIVLAIDARRISSDYSGPIHPELGLDAESVWTVTTHGGRTSTGIDAIKWAKRGVELGAGEILVTSMDRDGTQVGYDIELTHQIRESVSVPVIASGGAGSVGHISDVLKVADAALVAGILHFGDLTIAQIKQYCVAAGHPIRL